MKKTENERDHDVLIRLDANFNTFLKQYRVDIKELKDNVSARLNDHDVRIRKIEDMTKRVEPFEVIKAVKKNTKFRERFLHQIAVIVFFASLVLSLLMHLIEEYVISFFKR